MGEFFDALSEGVGQELLKHGTGATAEAILRPGWEALLVEAARTSLATLALQGAVTELRTVGKRGRPGLTKAAEDIEALRLKLPDPVKDKIDGFLDSTFKMPFWGDVATGVREDLAKTLSASREAGENLDQSAKRVQAAMRDTGRARAELIARTETTGSLNAGHAAVREHLETLGIIKGKMWLSILDGDTREEHRAANGQTVGVREDFIIGGERAQYPGAMNLSAAQRCNCRCAAISVLKED